MPEFDDAEVTVEWGVRWTGITIDDPVEVCADEAAARRLQARYPELGDVVSRKVIRHDWPTP